MDNRLILLNIIVCLYIFGGCVCRLCRTSLEVKVRVRFKYVAMGTGALTAALGQWMFPFPGGMLLGHLIFSISVSIAFYLSKDDWVFGVPRTALTNPQELLDASGNPLPY